jgi:hypothetical protein|tara:strand:- start:4013 stop:4237 length:225 start_codon:yes stop_codon:yes gene_type:complete
MKYIEINENYSPEEDEFNSIDLTDTRKIRLTLAHLSKLRKIREYRKHQKSAEAQQIKQQYGPSEAASGPSDLEI